MLLAVNLETHDKTAPRIGPGCDFLNYYCFWSDDMGDLAGKNTGSDNTAIFGA